ncbi:Hpt domain-containing protein [Reinekea sp.]|jgi:HPt (histidine-containing phosphotransfer) domain-containing protein|uniref:Hpt domain-containing protein n=1 Tax=Reinekea sp. TaxID=1970455 RepID=UPI002A830B88|nr:Hpt domain-containing protein [Reinekea sp.]
MTEQRLDPLILAELKELLEEEFPELIATFIRDAQQRLELLALAIETDDVSNTRMAAHSLKGSSSNIGFAQFAQLCHEVEEAAKALQLDSCRALLPALVVEAEWVLDQLEVMISES